MQDDDNSINWKVFETEILPKFNCEIDVKNWENGLLQTDDQFIKFFKTKSGSRFGIYFEDYFTDSQLFYAMCDDHKIQLNKFYPLVGIDSDGSDYDHEKWRKFTSRSQFDKTQRMFSSRYVWWNGNEISIDDYGKSHGIVKPFPFQCCFILFDTNVEQSE